MTAICPRCRMEVRVPNKDVRIVRSDWVDRIRFDCDDCGTVTGNTSFDIVYALHAAGTPMPLREEDVEGFRLEVASADAPLAAIAQREGAIA